jgi:hypothetical protein
MSRSDSAATAVAKPIERRYALQSLGRGTGAYVLFSNDGERVYVVVRYEEPPGQLYTGDGTTEISGVFWRTLQVRPESGLVTYEGAAGHSRATGIADEDRLRDAVLDLAPSLVEVDALLPTRAAAIQAALTSRFTARRKQLGPDQVWGVYDTATASWPAFIGGRRITDASSDREPIDRDADWLNRTYA